MARETANDRPETDGPPDALVGLSERSSGSMAGVLAALTLLVLFAIGAFWVIGAQQRDPAVVAQKDGAEQEVGKAAEQGEPSRSQSEVQPQVVGASGAHPATESRRRGESR